MYACLLNIAVIPFDLMKRRCAGSLAGLKIKTIRCSADGLLWSDEFVLNHRIAPFTHHNLMLCLHLLQIIM